MKKTLLYISLYLIPFSGFSQISFEKRIEFELKDGYENEQLMEFGKNGFIIQSKKKGVVDNKIEWRYELYNSNLELVDTKTSLISKWYHLLETYNTDEMIHSFYKDVKPNYSIVTVESSTLETTKVDGIIPKRAAIMDMEILGDYAYFKATRKSGPFVYSVNWKTGAEKIIPVQIGKNKSKKIKLKQLQLLKNSKEIFIYVNVPINKVRTDVYVMILNERGETEGVFNLTSNFMQSIIEISASKIGNGKYIFTGTYTSPGRKKTDQSKIGSEGLFFCLVENNEVAFIKTYNFLDLKNFLSYLPERQQEKIEKKKQKKEMKGQELKIKYFIAAHDVIAADNGFVFLGEAYYPTYRTESYTVTTTNAQGQMTTRTQYRKVFDGYQYTHAVLAKFNTDGIMQWDQCFEMWPSYKPYVVKRFISIADQDLNSIKMVFTSNNRIISKSVNFDGSVINEKKSETIETLYSGDKTRYTLSNVDFWYDNYFITSGTQVIKNSKDDDVKRKRRVYFISKIKFE